MNRKHVLIDSNVLCQKTLSEHEDVSMRSPETSPTKSFTARKGCYRFRSSFDILSSQIITRRNKMSTVQ